jgi:hypothetical protein
LPRWMSNKFVVSNKGLFKALAEYLVYETDLEDSIKRILKEIWLKEWKDLVSSDSLFYYIIMIIIFALCVGLFGMLLGKLES